MLCAWCVAMMPDQAKHLQVTPVGGSTCHNNPLSGGTEVIDTLLLEEDGGDEGAIPAPGHHGPGEDAGGGGDGGGDSSGVPLQWVITMCRQW